MLIRLCQTEQQAFFAAGKQAFSIWQNLYTSAIILLE
jgi:hypothetical protein